MLIEKEKWTYFETRNMSKILKLETETKQKSDNF